MHQNKLHRLVAVTLVILLAILPVPLNAENPPPPKDDWALALCIVAGIGLATAGIYIVAHKCKPKYYWLMSNDNPPVFWVGTATDKQCQIEDWVKIGGPYDKPEDAPAVHPDKTNRVNRATSEIMTVTVQQSSDLVTWTTVHEEATDLEDFSYSPTNTLGGMFRVSVRPSP